MAFRQLLSKSLLPNFEQDVARIMKKEVDSVIPMLNAMLTPQCYGYVNQGAAGAGAFRASAAASGAVSRVVRKVEIPVKQQGLFH